tara:strand:- start:4584 stop:5246 length:663 start_codon:yes stop_codon:yes gene_type:complete
MNNFDNFIKNFSLKSRHHQKLTNFLLPELKKIKIANILEFGVSDQAMSTELFIEYSIKEKCKIYSIDNIDYGSKFNSELWKFILSRDDNFNFVKNQIPEKFELILLDTIHEAKHVEKIFYNYFDLLKKDCFFFIDDINWIPYLKNSEKNRFYNEINNYETFEKILEIYLGNRDNLLIDFTFHGTGMCKIKKLTNSKLNKPKKINSRKFSIKNLLRKVLNR